MAVPKKKIARSTSKTRRNAYTKLQQAKIVNRAQFVIDTESNEPRLSHRADSTTGKYNGKTTTTQAQSTGTRVQA